MNAWILRGVAALVSLGAIGAFAQTFPAKPITIVVPFPPGGTTDVMTRAVAEKVRASLKQDVIVDNRPGAASLIALNHVRQQPADGHTLVLMSTTITTLPSLNSNAKYSVEKDFTPIAGVGRGVMMLMAHASTGIDSLAALIKQAKADPRKLNWGLASTLGFDHLGAMRIMKEAGVDIQTVGYKGDAQMRLDLIAGRVQVALGSPGGMQPHFAAGTLKPLAVANSARWPEFPDVPTLAEVGLRDATVDVWFATFGPAGIPREAVATLNREISAAIQTPDVIAVLGKIGFRPMPLNPAQMAELAYGSEREWARSIKAMGIKPE